MKHLRKGECTSYCNKDGDCPGDVCEICDDTGLVETNDVQQEGNIVSGVKVRCECTIKQNNEQEN